MSIPLQYHVERGILELRNKSSKAFLTGFYDPAPGEEKQLEVRYLHRNKLRYTVVNDNEPLTLPEL